MHFVDEFSRYSHIYFMTSKDKKESRRVLEEFLSDVRRLGWRVGRIRSDLGSEYVNNATTSRRNDTTKFEMVKSEFEKFVHAKTLILLRHPRMAQTSMVLLSASTIRWVKWQTHSYIMAGCPLFFGSMRTVIRTGSIID